MSKLIVNPGTGNPLEFLLQPGGNSVGRGAHNQIQISDDSVSGSHCKIILQDGVITVRDLGSTNGTFVNGAPIQESVLLNGQSFRLGNVEVRFQAEEHAATPVPASAAAPKKLTLAGNDSSAPSHVVTAPSAPAVPATSIPALSPGGVRSGGLRIAGSRTTTAAAEMPAPEVLVPTVEIPSGPRFCRFHPKSAARFVCPKCNRTFCELCVSSRSAPGGAAIRTCRSCGVECLPLQMQGGTTRQRGFFGQLPGALIYPFKGTGLLVLIVATIVFAALSFVSRGLFTIALKMAVLGYVFLYMQNIIHATAAEEKELPGLPDFDGLFSAFFTLAGTVLMSFGPAIGLGLAKVFEVDAIPTSAITAALIFGCVYFPMAFLATAMKDTALAGNPLIVLPAMVKVPLEYLVTVVLMTGVFGFQKLGDMLSSHAGSVALSTRSMSEMFLAFGFKAVWAFISVYLLTVNMRILGLLYVTKKHKLGWF